MSKYLNDQTFATNPGNVRLSASKLQALEPELFEDRNFKCGPSCDVDHPAAEMRERFEEHLAHGDSRAAMVVSLEPLVVAALSDDLDAAETGPLLCAGVTTYNSLRNSGARPGDTVAVQGIGGLGHLAIQYAARMGFRTVALSHGSDKEALARELGAHEYVDTQKVDAAEGLRRLGGADLVLATAPHGSAIASTVNGLKPRGKLLIVAAAFEPLPISALSLLSGKTIAGWPSGSAIDSEETMTFSALAGVRPRIEMFPLERAEEAFAKVMSNRVRFRAVLVP